MKVLGRLLGFTLSFIIFMILGGVLKLLPIDGKTKRSWTIYFTKVFTGILTKILSVTVSSQMIESSRTSKIGTMYLANHLSYLDILVLLSQIDSIFIAAKDVGESPGLGWIANIADCLSSSFRI